LLQFLYESGLILRDKPVVSLAAADLRWAWLVQAHLRGANLSDADLRMANLRRARGWTVRQLSAAKSFEGATMPDGQILRGLNTPNGPSFEEWLKDRSGRKEE
jgi:hypothetical protein